MLANSPAGLYMLDPARDVTVTREEDHQHVLARYPVTQSDPRRVAVELAWCTIASGKHKGARAIEVRLDGHRTGELTHAMTTRYAPFVEAVTGAGLRPGCEATISSGDRGLQIQLHLPTADAPLPNPRPLRQNPTQSPGAWTAPPSPRSASQTRQAPASPPTSSPRPAPGPRPSYQTHIPGYPVTSSTQPMPAVPGPPSRRKSKKVPIAFAGAVVGIVALISGIAGGEEDPDPRAIAATTSTTRPTTTLAPITTTRPTTTRPTTTTPEPKPTTTRPKPTTTRPAPPPPAPKPKPAPKPDCNPNYDPCVPNDPVDVDCAGGSGNGPSYVEVTVRVIGKDVYGLDRDKDGLGCE